MDTATLIYQADAIAHYSEWEDRLRNEARALDQAECIAAAMERRQLATLVHRALVNEERGLHDHSGERG